MSYVLPAASFQQEFLQLAAPVQQTLSACIVGPKRKVVKAGYSPTSESDYGGYDFSEDQDLEFLGLPAGEVVDAESVRVVFTDVHARYGTVSGTNKIEVGTEPNRLKLGAGISASLTFYEDGAAGTSRLTEFGERDARIGDRVKITHEDGTLWSRIIGFVDDMSDPAYSDVEDPAVFNDPGNPADQVQGYTPTIVVGNAAETRVSGDVDEDTAGDRYIGDLSKGVVSETYVLEVITAGGYGVGQFRVTSSGGDSVSSVTAPANDTTRMDVGTRGLGVIFQNLGTRALEVGEKFSLAVTAPYTQIAASITGGTDYEGLIDTTYQIRVIKGGTWAQSPKVSVTTTNNIDSYGAQVISDSEGTVILGNLGLSVSLVDGTEPQGGLRLGDIYNVVVTAPVSEGPRVVKIKDPIPVVDSGGGAINAEGYDLSVSFYSHQGDVSIPSADYPLSGDENWSVDGDTITFKSGINVFDSTVLDGSGDETPIPVEVADINIYYTAVITEDANKLGVISSLSSVPGILGLVLPENEVAFGVDRALRNSAGQPVYYITTADDTVEAYTEALKLAERNSDVYYMVPMSHDSAVIDLFRSHAINLSSEAKGMERVAIVNKTVATVEDLFVTREDTDNEAWTGYISAGPELSPAQYRRVTMPGADFVTAGVRLGDQVRTNFSITAMGDTTYETYKVEEVIDEETLLITTGPSGPVGSIDALHRLEIVRPMTAMEQAELAAAQSEALGDRRVTNVFPEQAVSVEGDLVAGYFLAAAYAGLNSSVVAHQPVTNVELGGFLSVPRVLENFSIDELNVIAGGGTMIVAQDTTGGAIYVRHQLTTDMTDANHSELSITRNVDAITRFLRGYIKPLIGQYNITPEFLVQLETLSRQRLDFYIQSTQRVKAGPPIIEIGAIIAVQNPSTRTGVLMEIPLELPYPANNILTKLVIL